MNTNLFSNFLSFKIVTFIFHIHFFSTGSLNSIYRSQYFYPRSFRESLIVSRELERKEERYEGSKMAITINRVLRCLGGAALKSRMSSGYERPFSLSLFARGVWRVARGAPPPAKLIGSRVALHAVPIW